MLSMQVPAPNVQDMPIHLPAWQYARQIVLSRHEAWRRETDGNTEPSRSLANTPAARSLT